MNLLIIGGAGGVASRVIPFLKPQHNIRVFDLRPPADATLDYRIGAVTDYDAMRDALTGMDALIYMAMGTLNWTEVEGIQTGFDVNTKAVYLALRAAREAGIQHAVYTSSMSIYDGELTTRYFYDEAIPFDGRNLYALTKYMGEMVCYNAVVQFGMSANVLRMCFPITDEAWLEIARAGKLTFHTAASDLARAFDAALRHRNGYQAYMISGDYEGKIINMAKAKRELGWEPLARP